MKDRSEPLSNLAFSAFAHNEAPPTGGLNMTKDEMLLKLLDELCRSWMETSTPVEIGSDLEKVRMLKEARAQITEGRPSELVQQLYREVFLRDVWSGDRNQSGSTA
jgi:hypothetical protein